MGSRRSSLSGMEVPIIGSDAVKWVQLSVPCSSNSTSQTDLGTQTQTQNPPQFPSTEDAASCVTLGNPPTNFIWRIHKSRPHELEIIQICSYTEFPRIGLRIEFSNALCPFALICKNEALNSSGSSYMLYALTVVGDAYLIRLKDIINYASCSVFPADEIVEFNIRTCLHYGAITAIAATAGCLLVGGNDGSVGYFQLGMLDPSSPGFLHELRDDFSFGRLWGLMSRTRTVAAVQDLIILEIDGKNFLFVLHLDGVLRVWDLLNCCKVFSYTINTPNLIGVTFMRFWAGEAKNHTSIIPLAVLYKQSLEVDLELLVYRLHLSLGGKINFLLEPSGQRISLEEGGLIDVKISANKLWILKDDRLILHDLFGANGSGDVEDCYALQEACVAEQLFQSAEHSTDDFFWLSNSVYSSMKDRIAPLVSSIFLRRLFVPGVFHNAVLRATLEDHTKHLIDSEFYSLSADGMKKEILSIIEHEGVSRGPLSFLYWWKTFCARYFDDWCRSNAPCSLFIDSSTNAIGLIRKSSISLFRCLEDIELLAFGSFDELGGGAKSTITFSGNFEREVLFEVLQCTSNLHQQLGKAASALFYESFFSELSVSSEEVVLQLMKILETGYYPSVAPLRKSELGADTAWEKEVADHKSIRNFSMDMFLSLHSLYSKANSWGKVLHVILSYLKFLVPSKEELMVGTEAAFNINTYLTIQATSQVAKVMFESALDILLLLSYMLKISGQVNMSYDDVSTVQLELVPMIQEILIEWHIIYYFGTTPSESAAVEDFSSQFSSLEIDGKVNRRSWYEKLGKCDFTLAFILLLNRPLCYGDQSLSSRCLLDPSGLIISVRKFTSWIIWGSTREESSFFAHAIEVSLILLQHGQYDAVEYLLTTVDAHLRKEKISESIQGMNNEWCKALHLLGCCLLARAHNRSHGSSMEKKVREAICCFFRAGSVRGAAQSLQGLSYDGGLPQLGYMDCVSPATWRLLYYQWAMQIFERYNMSEGAVHFAFAALEQVDEVLRLKDVDAGAELLNESPNTVKGRLWANVFKFTLDLNYYQDAYCAIISNPDEESKSICLRRFIIVLYERGAVKILCDGQLPLIGLAEKISQELAWKAECSDVSAKPNPYKLLYSFEMNQHNWRKAASYIYLYSLQLKSEAALKDHHLRSLALHERLNCLSAAINALYLVNPAYAWINPLLEGKALQKQSYPSKRARITMQEQEDNDCHIQRLQSPLDIEKLENEFVLTSAEYLLSLENIRWTFTGAEIPISDLIDLLVKSNQYDMTFTVLVKFFHGSELKRELERVFIAMSIKCCPSMDCSSLVGDDFRRHGLLLTSSKDNDIVRDSLDIVPIAQQSRRNFQWETLELYMEKYVCFHPRLPVIVAETLLCADPQIELPLWLVHMFKVPRREITLGMGGAESSPTSLFQLYVDYGRYPDASNLLLDYIESLASVRPADIIRRKKTTAVWFPYTTIERLLAKIEESISSGHMADQCAKLKILLHRALHKHFDLLKIDSDDLLSSTAS